ncbi:hypothetical protein HCC30_15495 [Streptomyces sp. HNM0574]|nr:hypothetical protein [Streptomyces sp. HNM0574]
MSLPARIVVAVAVAGVAVAAAVHLGMVFLHVAPKNAVSKEHSETIDAYVYPEFEQNWKLFAPNPLQVNVAMQARARIAKPDGSTETTGWFDLSAMDGEGIRHNIAPSHTQQNELRRAWELFRNYHDDEGRPVGLRGDLSQTYIKRIAVDRLGGELDGGTVEHLQVRSADTPVAPPAWSEEKKDTKTEYRLYPWWPVGSEDVRGGGQQ